MATPALDLERRDQSPIAMRVRRWDINLLSILFPAAFVLFMCEIARIGLSFIPGVQEVFWMSAYACLFWFAARKPSIYLALLRRNLPFLVAAAFAILSALWSPTPNLSAYSGTLLLLNILAGFVFAERLGIERFIVLLFYFCATVQIASLGLFVIHHPSAFSGIGEVKGLYLHKNALSMHSILFYLTSLVLFVSGWHRRVAALGILLAITNLMLSRSGTGMLLLVFTTGILGVCFLTVKGRLLSPMLAGIFLAALCAVIAAMSLYRADIVGDVLGFLGKDATLTGRTVLWDEAFRMFEQRPWFGLGYNSYWNSPECFALSINVGGWLGSFHNIYLDRLVDVGVVGLVFFMIALLNVIRTSWLTFLKEKTAISAWPFAYVCFISVLGLSEFPIFWNGEFQFLLSFCAAATCGVRFDTDRSVSATVTPNRK
jgi:exopolysaccharide production protein ExoQ